MNGQSDAPSQTKDAGRVLAVEGLVKRYGKTTAVENVSFEIRRGEILGLLGPNGAGKTTTLEIIAGLRRPDGGDVIVGGFSVLRDVLKAQRLLGVAPQGLALYEDLSAKQNLTYFAKLRGLKRAEREAQISDVLDITGLRDVAGKRVRTFSGGMKRRLNIGVGLLGRPELLLLDEPTVGIDPQSRRHILDAVRRLAESGIAVLYTSHYMEEIEYLCKRVAIMDHGRIIAQGPIDEVRALAGDSVVLRVPTREDGSGGTFDLEAVRRALSLPVEARGGELRVVLTEGSGQAPGVLNVLQEHGVQLDGMRLETPNLETVFLSLTGKALRDQAPEHAAS